MDDQRRGFSSSAEKLRSMCLMESVDTTVVMLILLASRLARVLLPVPLVPASSRMTHCFCSMILQHSSMHCLLAHHKRNIPALRALAELKTQTVVIDGVWAGLLAPQNCILLEGDLIYVCEGPCSNEERKTLDTTYPTKG